MWYIPRFIYSPYIGYSICYTGLSYDYPIDSPVKTRLIEEKRARCVVDCFYLDYNIDVSRSFVVLLLRKELATLC
jgi:hypothetical protein